MINKSELPLATTGVIALSRENILRVLTLSLSKAFVVYLTNSSGYNYFGNNSDTFILQVFHQNFTSTTSVLNRLSVSALCDCLELVLPFVSPQPGVAGPSYSYSIFG